MGNYYYYFYINAFCSCNPFANENKNIPDVVYQNLMRKYGLDKPYSEQYVIYLKNIEGEILESL